MKIRKVYLNACLILLAAVLLGSLPAFATEGGLIGIHIGATPKDLMTTYGLPSGVIFSTGNGLALNTMRGGVMQTAGNTPPEWAKTVWPSRLQTDQQMWIYQLKDDLVAGFILKGVGDAATVTDIIAASFKPNTKVKTEGGIYLGDSLAKIMLNYGYPPLMQPFQVGAAGKATTTPVASSSNLSGRNMPNFNRADLGRPSALSARGTGPVAPMANTASPAASAASRVVVVDQRPITFAKNFMVLYNGIAFTLYDFKVVRIHITQ